MPPRLRLREEVDVLQHLSRAAATEGGHPNILMYVDSWEEDEALFIRTELCELGNFARFLWEYGKAFPRLDEARVWKVFADLSNVSLTCRTLFVLPDPSSFLVTCYSSCLFVLFAGPSIHSRVGCHPFRSQASEYLFDPRRSLQDW